MIHLLDNHPTSYYQSQYGTCTADRKTIHLGQFKHPIVFLKRIIYNSDVILNEVFTHLTQTLNIESGLGGVSGSTLSNGGHFV